MTPTISKSSEPWNPAPPFNVDWQYFVRSETLSIHHNIAQGGRGGDSARQILVSSSSGHFLVTGNISSGNRLMALFSQLTSTTLHMTRLHVLCRQVQSSQAVGCGLSETTRRGGTVPPRSRLKSSKSGGDWVWAGACDTGGALSVAWLQRKVCQVFLQHSSHATFPSGVPSHS